MGPREHIAFLAGSTNRVRILEALREQPHRKCELATACGLSRSTVHRALDGLEERAWIRSDDGAYRLTAGGEFVLDQYGALETSIERVERWGPFLNRLGDAATTLPPAALDGAEVIATTPENPHATITHLANAIATSSAETFYGVSPIVSPMLNEASQGLIESGAHMELVIDASVFDTSKTAYPDALDDAHTLSNFELYLHPDELSFGLVILDDRVLVGAYDERGVLRECLDGTNETLTAWATEQYETFRATATRADALSHPG